MMDMRVHWTARTTGHSATAPPQSRGARSHHIDRTNIAFAGLLSSWQGTGHSAPPAMLSRRLPMRRIAVRRG